MKKLILILILILSSINAFSQSIAYVNEKYESGKNYCYFYDSNGNEIQKVQVNNARLVDYSSRLVIFEVDKYYFIYTNTIKLVSQVSISNVGRIDHVFTDSETGKSGFVTTRGNKFYIWDESGENYNVINK